MHKSPFIVVRYPSGGAGRFLSTALQLSNDIAHWDSTVELTKGTEEFALASVNYVDSKFPVDLSYHLRMEPDLPYRSDFYSGTYDRGTDVTIEEYNRLLADEYNDYYFDNIQANKKVNLILHKSEIPQFMLGSTFVNVIINSARAKEWVEQMVWSKHYHVESPNLIRQLQHDPAYCNPKRKELVKKFFTGDAVIHVDSIDEFKMINISQNSEFSLFSNTENLYQHPSNQQVTNMVFDLDNIFSVDTVIDNIEQIARGSAISMPNKDLLRKIYNIWWSRNCK
jgi:hypothetical protein